MKNVLDWSQPQRCRDCGRRLRHGNRLCRPCSEARRRAGIRRDDQAQHKPRRRGNPTVAELAAQGHPCVSPAPKPSNTRTYPL
nr:MAG TPA: PYK2-ASSOCIATED PROTEIN BETA-BINDING MODULE, ANKYRIN REPEATS, METAL.1A [Caudoviricetes sp.]